MLKSGVIELACKIHQLAPAGLALLLCAPVYLGGPAMAAEAMIRTSPGRISSNFLVQTVDEPTSKRLKQEINKVLKT